MGEVLDFEAGRRRRFARERRALRGPAPVDVRVFSGAGASISGSCNPTMHVWPMFGLRCFCGERERDKDGA